MQINIQKDQIFSQPEVIYTRGVYHLHICEGTIKSEQNIQFSDLQIF